MNITSTNVRSFFVKGVNLATNNISPKILGGSAVIVALIVGLALKVFDKMKQDKMNQNALIEALRTFNKSYMIRTGKDKAKVTQNLITKCRDKYDNLKRVTSEYQMIYDNLGSIRSWFSEGHVHLEKANVLLQNAGLTIFNDAKRKFQTEDIEITHCLRKSGCPYNVARFLVSKVTDKERTSAALFVEGLNKTFESGAATFVEEDFVGNDGKAVQAGWHDAAYVAAQATPIPVDAKENKTIKRVVEELKKERAAEGIIRSIPAFSNEYGRLTLTEKPLEIFDPISGENVKIRNAELVFYYQQFIVMYCQASNIPSDKERISEMKRIAPIAKKVLAFCTKPTENQVAERSPYCVMTRCREGEGSNIKSDVCEKVKGLAMKRTVEAKLKSRPDLVLKLLLTDDKDCLTIITDDDVWGTGLDGKGQDLLAKLYQQKRKDLRKLDLKRLIDWFESPTGDDNVTTYIPLNLNDIWLF